MTSFLRRGGRWPLGGRHFRAFGVVLATAFSIVGSACAQEPPQDAGKTSKPGDAPPLSPEQAIIKQVFQQYETTQNPLSPKMLNEAQKRADEAEKAATRKQPSFRDATARVSGTPGSKIPTVYLEIGQPTAIAFVDRSGAPWPILQCDFSPGFDGKEPPRGSHVITLTPGTIVEHGSMACSLEHHTNPVTLLLEAGTGTHNPSFLAQVDEMGPLGKPPLYERPRQTLAAGDDALQSLLYGVPPDGAVRLTIEGASGDTQAWRYKGSLYLRTPLTLWSPAPLDEVRLNDLNVYRLDPLPLLRLSDQGVSIDIHVQGARVIGVDNDAIQRAVGATDGQKGQRPLSLAGVITRSQP